MSLTDSSVEGVEAQPQVIQQTVLAFIKKGKYRQRNQLRPKMMFSVFDLKEVVSQVGGHEC